MPHFILREILDMMTGKNLENFKDQHQDQVGTEQHPGTIIEEGLLMLPQGHHKHSQGQEHHQCQGQTQDQGGIVKANVIIVRRIIKLYSKH